jgi:predicted dehydrogenase
MEPYWIHNHGGVPIDNGTRSVDIVGYPIGSLCRAFVFETRRNQDLDGEDTVNMSMRTFDGICADVGLSWSNDKALDGITRVFGTYGSIQEGWREVRCPQVSSPDSAARDSQTGGRWVTIDSSSGRPGALQEVTTRPAG